MTAPRLTDAQRVQRAKDLALQWAASPLTRQMATELIDALGITQSPLINKVVEPSLADYQVAAQERTKQSRIDRMQRRRGTDYMTDLWNRGGAA